MEEKIKVHATGCCLCDKIISNIDFSSHQIRKYLSRTRGDGGIIPGHLTFKEDLETFSGKDIHAIIDDISTKESFLETNIGGPAIIALICASQLTRSKDVIFYFFQNYGRDSNGDFIRQQLNRYAPRIHLDYYRESGGTTAETLVLSDPTYNGGQGERSFINNIGNAGDYTSAQLTPDFFSADILLFGATALTPQIHSDLHKLLKKGKKSGCINIVTTVYDFINEKLHPEEPWPLGKNKKSYPFIDLLVCSLSEALALTGADFKEEAAEIFMDGGLPAFIITDGVADTAYYAHTRSLFYPTQGLEYLKVPDLDAMESTDLNPYRGDTTGCGDNFAGGVLAHIISEKESGKERINMIETVKMGNCCGASACYTLGGMMKENPPGQKLKLVEDLNNFYTEQLQRRK